MDYIREFDIQLDKEQYYAGETVCGKVILDTIENFQMKSIRVALRGKAHTEWKVMLSGDRRTVKEDQYFIDQRQTIWGEKHAIGKKSIIPRGVHKFPFSFDLPESALPCSFESRVGQIRYFFKVIIDIPYASPPQGMKYFTIIGPHIDCMDEHYLKPIVLENRRSTCCWCCKRGTVSLKSVLERSAYVCKESIKLKVTIDNQGEEDVWLRIRLEQICEYFIDRGVLGVSKEQKNLVLEYKGNPVKAQKKIKWDSGNVLVIPVVPTTLVNICRLIQIYYVLTVSLDTAKETDLVSVNMPLTIATVPFRIPNSGLNKTIKYEPASTHVEGGQYLAPDFLLGQVYDGNEHYLREPIVLYKPVYVTIDKSEYTEY
uniref:Arrestin C-terminal-like domain-containing protein n=1 Tax=Dendroctonus ponderosae TaxID=77166 RepID=A0AAR5PSR8_DENPD